MANIRPGHVAIYEQTVVKPQNRRFFSADAYPQRLIFARQFLRHQVFLPLGHPAVVMQLRVVQLLPATPY